MSEQIRRKYDAEFKRQAVRLSFEEEVASKEQRRSDGYVQNMVWYSSC